MLQAQQVEELICLISAMSRESIGRRLREFRGNFPVDLTPAFVESIDLERLRHIFLALCLQAKHMPEVGDEDEADVVAEQVA